jgi:hypothetical protein
VEVAVEVFVLSLVFVGLYWLSSVFLAPYIFRVGWSPRVMRLTGYVFTFIAILFIMWWGYAHDPRVSLSWLRWIPWALSAITFGAAAALHGEGKRLAVLTKQEREALRQG